VLVRAVERVPQVFIPFRGHISFRVHVSSVTLFSAAPRLLLCSRLGRFSCILECRLTSVAADGGARERAEALAGARVHGAILLIPPQQNAIR
jgi:hypothetical protein